MTGIADTDIAAGAIETAAPTAVASVDATGGAARIDLTWSAATDNVGVSGLQDHAVGRPGRHQRRPYTPVHEVIATVAAGQTAYEDTDVAKGVVYSYEIRAVDAVGNVGPRSETATATRDGSRRTRRHRGRATGT